tara:strand:- start:329 stop:1936 length:1608 start_codon:yes stop_codon:yes gene_type:complete
MDTITFNIGKKELQKTEFSRDTKLTLRPKEGFLMGNEPSNQPNSMRNGKKRLQQRVIRKNGNNYKKGYIGKDYDPIKEDVKQIKKDLKTRYENDDTLIKGPIKLTVEDINNLSLKELELFEYIPDVIHYEDKTDLEIPPYYLGYWLGDGTSKKPEQITIGKKDQPIILPYLETIAEKFGLKLKTQADARKKESLIFNITAENRSDSMCRCVEWLDDDDKFNKLMEICSYIDKIDKLNSSVGKQTKILVEDDIFEKLIKLFNDIDKNALLCAKERKTLPSLDKKYGIAIHTRTKYYKIWKENGGEVGFREFRKVYIKELTDTRANLVEKYGLHVSTARKYHKIWKKNGEEGLHEFRNDYLKRMDKSLMSKFKKMNLVNNKHIPEKYLYSSVENRMELLAGLIDSDGYAIKAGSSESRMKFRPNTPNYTITSWEITQKNERLSNDIKKLAESLGMFVYFTTKMASCTYMKDGVKVKSTPCKVCRMTITPYNNYDVPVKLDRKCINSMNQLNQNPKGLRCDSKKEIRVYLKIKHEKDM